MSAAPIEVMREPRVDRLANRHGEIWLNVAAGHYLLDDFINIDGSFQLRLLPLYPMLKAALKTGSSFLARVEEYREARASGRRLMIRNCLKRLPVPDGSVDHILVSHFLEHVYRDEARRLLLDYRRALKPGGTLHVIVPDLAARAARYIASDKADACDEFIHSLIFNERGRPPLLTRVLECWGGFGLFHRWMYDERQMKALLIETGFEIQQIDDSPSAGWRRAESGQVNLLATRPSPSAIPVAAPNVCAG